MSVLHAYHDVIHMSFIVFLGWSPVWRALLRRKRKSNHRAEYGTHSMRRTKATLIHRRTKNLRAVQLLLGHSKLESTVRYLGIEVDDALEISEQTEI